MNLHTYANIICGLTNAHLEILGFAVIYQVCIHHALLPCLPPLRIASRPLPPAPCRKVKPLLKPLANAEKGACQASEFTSDLVPRLLLDVAGRRFSFPAAGNCFPDCSVMSAGPDICGRDAATIGT